MHSRRTVDALRDFYVSSLMVVISNQGCGVGGKMSDSNSDFYLPNFFDSDSALFQNFRLYNIT